MKEWQKGWNMSWFQPWKAKKLAGKYNFLKSKVTSSMCHPQDRKWPVNTLLLVLLAFEAWFISIYGHLSVFFLPSWAVGQKHNKVKGKTSINWQKKTFFFALLTIAASLYKGMTSGVKYELISALSQNWLGKAISWNGKWRNQCVVTKNR